jgi:hypothetical protein
MNFPVHKSVQVRCYGALNDFLPLRNRGKTFPYRYRGSPSIKELLEGMGIPHVEIAHVLIDDDFAHWSKGMEGITRISVYPDFKEIKGIPHLLNPEYPKEEISFVADAHLGKLARSLRMVGYYTLYNVDLSDNEIITISNEETRVILTRDKGILFHGSTTWGYFLRSQDPRVQFHEVLSMFGLPCSSPPLSRCMVCNGLIDFIPKNLAMELVETRIIDHYKSFYRCSNAVRFTGKGIITKK